MQWLLSLSAMDVYCLISRTHFKTPRKVRTTQWEHTGARQHSSDSKVTMECTCKPWEYH